jgi:rubrerythrin
MPFDIEDYKQRSAKLDLSDIDWAHVADHPLPRGAIDAMLYMMDIETHTAIYLSELLVSKACMEPVITAFLSIWGYEEMYHGDAFVKFLRAYGLNIPDDRPREIRLKDTAGRITATMAIMFGSYAMPFFPALYLTVGAYNELTTLTGYQALIRHARHPILTQVVSRIIKQERVHYAFYRSQAELHLRRSAMARGVTRWYMLKHMVVVGEGLKAPHEVDQLALYLFRDDQGRAAARAVDIAMGELPGLRGVNFLERALDRAATRSPGLVSPAWDEPHVLPRLEAGILAG